MTLSLIAACLILVQSVDNPANKPEFEVASIKPAAPDPRGMWLRVMPGGKVDVTNMTLKDLIQVSYHIQPFQVSGGPPWLNSERWDISAKPENEPKGDDIAVMMQGLLADRFHFVFHRETKEVPIYALVLARKDGKLGSGLTEPKEGSCITLDPKDPPPAYTPGARYCGNQMMGRGKLTGISIPVSNMAPMFSRLLGRKVIDKTGLTGKWDISLEWTPDEAQFASMPPDAPKPSPSDVTGPSIFTALQEQLGLKLESQKGPVEIFVIEKAEKPTEN